jgi:hypothetical protein
MKLRFKTWYWGKYVIEGQRLGATTITRDSEGFEEYTEAKHGWQHSEEAKRKV